MEEQTMRQLQGATELLRDGVQGTARSIEAAQLEIAEIPYSVLRRLPVIAGPAQAAERVQRNLTRLAYWLVSAAAGAVAAGILLGLQLYQATRAG